MKLLLKTGLSAFLSLAQLGCTGYFPQPAHEPPDIQESANSQEFVVYPLDFYDWASNASLDDIDQEVDRLQNREQTDSSPIDSVQLAILLSINSEQQDLVFARRLLEDGSLDCEYEAVCQQYLLFGELWLENLDKRREITELQKNQTDGRDKITDLEARVNSLQSQIEALTNIEQQIIEREQLQVTPQ